MIVRTPPNRRRPPAPGAPGPAPAPRVHGRARSAPANESGGFLFSLMRVTLF